MKKPFLPLLLAAAMFASCRPSVQDYVEFLYASMPLPDSLVHPRAYWEENVEKTLEVRARMDWGIPEREFRHFVLPLRVNNENLDDFRTKYADSLCARVEGMGIAEAALEINHWCHERATYTPSDGRTLGPEALIRSGLGRCGEESTFTVAALRAAGIPARQVYTPRWAHTDDNHAWVEVWAGGKWHFMGACEPEAVLDLGWFNSSVSRAMLLHTKAFGGYDGPEDVISRTHAYTEINVIDSYIPARRTVVTVLDGQGAPVAGADIEFKIYNYAEFYTVARYKTDSRGQSALDTGLGDIVVWASEGERFGLGVVSGEAGEIVLDKTFGKEYSFDLDIVPPSGNPLPDLSIPGQKALNSRRLACEDSIRLARPHPRAVDPGIGLSEKDLIDVTRDVIEDALSTPATGDLYIDCPRVELEMLMPCREEIRSGLAPGAITTSADAVVWVRDSISIDRNRNPQGLRIPPVVVWRSRIADPLSRDIFFVALCRTLGFPSRFDSVTGKPQYRQDGSWIPVDFDRAEDAAEPKGVLQTVSFGPRKPEYYRHYTISRVSEGSCRLCEFPENEPVACSNEFEQGYYMLTSGARMADGSVLAHVEMFNVVASEAVSKPIVLRESSQKVSVIGSIDAEKPVLVPERAESCSAAGLPDLAGAGDGTSDGAADGAVDEVTILSQTGRDWYILCILDERDEPSIHAVRQLSGIAGELNAWGRKIVILGGSQRPEGLENAVFGRDSDGKTAAMLLAGVGAVSTPAERLPYVAVADSFGRVVWFSSGYNTSLGENLLSVIARL